MRRRTAAAALALISLAITGWLYLDGSGDSSSGQSRPPVTTPAAGDTGSVESFPRAPKPEPTYGRATSRRPTSSHLKQTPATRSAAGPLAGLTIAVDPGHNGGNATNPEEIARPVRSGAGGGTKPCNTTGTETNDGDLTEARFNWLVAMDLAPRLRELGASVVLTRQSNDGVGPCVDERAEAANRADATADIAIHADGYESEGAHGFDVIHPLVDEMIAPAMAAPSLQLAVAIRDALVQSGVPPANYIGHEGLDARDDLAGLNLARVPAVLVELGNMRSAEEAAKLESPAYRRRLASALAAGLLAFVSR